MRTKPSIHVSAHVDSYGESPVVDDKYARERKSRLRKEIAYIKKQLNNWDHKKVGEHVKAQLQDDLKSKQEELKEKKQLSHKYTISMA